MIMIVIIIMACAVSSGAAWHLGFNAGRDRLYRELEAMLRHPSNRKAGSQ